VKTSTNTALLVILGIMATGLIEGLVTGQIAVPEPVRPWVALIMVPVLLYVVSILPARGTEDLVDLAQKLAPGEATTVLRSYLHNKAAAGTGLSVAMPQPVSAPTPSNTEPRPWEGQQVDPNEPPPEWLPKR
jgi:hypothetical protein